MNSFQIKIIAIVTMVIDHIGIFFFPDLIILRIIGRVSFPLFAFLIANGAHFSKNINKYCARILIFALISQIPYHFAKSLINQNLANLNILFTFFLSLFAISILQKTKNKILALFVIILSATAAYFFKTDYGIFGILLTVSFYLFFKNIKATVWSFLLIVAIYAIAPALNASYLKIGSINIGSLFSLLSLIFILSYNYREGLKFKYLFYIFFPLHYLLIYLIKSLT